MWTADKIIYNGIDTYIKAYQGSSLIWEKNIPVDPSDDITLPYVTFRAEEAGSTLGLKKLSTNQTLQYSTNKSNWKTFDTSSNITLDNVGDEVYVRGKLSANNTASSYTRFSMTGKIAAYGNCNAIWDYTNLEASLKENCGRMMFFNCTSLTKAPELPATTMANNCYQNMFSYCSLTKAPSLPATTMFNNCYQNMFRGCTSLKTAPSLPAKKLASWCYSQMFSGCTSLKTAPSLPAKKLASWCYSQMFEGCTSLLFAAQLPATALADYCYHSMFSGCTSLTTAPELPATTLAEACYNYMFHGCTSLQNITCLATDISASLCLYDWVLDVASTGTFYKDFETEWTTGTSGIPSGWTVVNINEPEVPEEDPADDITLPYVTFKAEEAGSRVSLAHRHPNHTLEYSTDKINWSAFTTSPTGWTSIRLANIGDEVYVRGKLTSNQTISNFTQFKIEYGKVAAYGNCNAIWNYEDLNAPLIYDACGYCLFQNCLALTKAPKLPATTLTTSCYQNMFNYCSSLTKAPKLPATTLANSCYNHMFYGCTSLVEAPKLPATTLSSGCYRGMFYNCQLLTQAPELPATTLADYCYAFMFYACSSLTKAPELPATTLTTNCYNQMFYYCPSLQEITCLATDISADNCLTNWFGQAAATGTFYKDPSMTSWPTGTSGIPSGWTVLDYTA